jgi:hypothetical protein
MHENICEWVCETLVGEIVMINGCWWHWNVFMVMELLIKKYICGCAMNYWIENLWW